MASFMTNNVNKVMNLRPSVKHARRDFLIVNTRTEKCAGRLGLDQVMRTPVYAERLLATTTTRTAWTTPATHAGEADDARLTIQEIDAGGPDPFADEPKWAAWKVTVAVVIFCGAFWTGIGYLAMRLMG